MIIDYVSIILSFGLTLFFIWLFKPISERITLVDKPGGRKKHQGLIPLTGGIAMFGGIMFAIPTLNISLLHYRSFIWAIGLLLFIGFLDDLKELRPRSKFFCQIIAAFIMTSWGNLKINDLGHLFNDTSIILANWAIPFTIFYTVGAVNALNMSDGMDGLAGSIALISHLALLILAIFGNRLHDTQILLIITVSIFAFLFFNFRIPGRKSALVFMGNSGSMFLGFSIVWFSISLSQSINPVMRPITALWIFAIPLFDIVTIIFRRLRKRKSPFSSDRTHFHHILQRANFSVNQSIIIILIINIFCCVVGLLGEFYSWPENMMFFAYLILLSIFFTIMLYAWKIVKFLKHKIH